MKSKGDYAAIRAKLQAAKKILIFPHQRPDGDALGSSFGMREFFRRRGVTAETYFPEDLPYRYTKLYSGQLTGALSEAELREFDTILVLDCANVARLGAPSGCPVELLRTLNFLNVDHHGGNNIAATLNWIVPEASSASLLAATLAFDIDPDAITPDAATAFLSGMMTDTGSFRFSNTDPATFRMAAQLLEKGANLEKISNAIYFSKPFNQVQFENEFVAKQLKIGCDGKFSYAYIPPELCKKYNFSLKEDEGLIDLLREIDGVVISALLRPDFNNNGTRASLRSKDSRYPVAPLAQALGGGGHALAAGATIPPGVDAEKFLLEKISQLLDNK